MSELLVVRFRHRAATTGSVGFVQLLIESSTPLNKLRLNTADRIGKSLLLSSIRKRHICLFYSINLCLPRYPLSGNTPLHLAMDSAHAEAAILLINAGADRTRVRIHQIYPHDSMAEEPPLSLSVSFTGKSRWRNSGEYPGGWRTGTETCETACH